MSNVLFKKICRELNEFAESNDYRKPRCIRVEFTSFQDPHKAIRGRNGVGELVELSTQVIEADAVHVEQWERSNALAIYVKARTKSDHGFGPKSGIHLRVRDPKGKYYSLDVYPRWEKEEIDVGRFQSLFGYESAAEYDADGFKEFMSEESTKVVRLADDSTELDETAASRIFTQSYYRELVSYQLKDGDAEEFEKFLTFKGWKLIKCFVFTERFWGISPKYLEHSDKGLELGWMTHSTYNSLPCTLKIFKARGISTVKLSDLGVEEAGYYSHHDQMRVLPEHADRAKRFARKFKAKTEKIRDTIVKQALKAAT